MWILLCNSPFMTSLNISLDKTKLNNIFNVNINVSNLLYSRYKSTLPMIIGDMYHNDDRHKSPARYL